MKKNINNTIRIIFFLSSIVLSCNVAKKNIYQSPRKEEIISVEYPEVYELANIILALTDYGINDKWQVRKDFAYYNEMREYFKPFENHPIIDSVNFSRARWQEYLSFRTDSYAFELDGNYQLRRLNNFQSFEIKTFDKYKLLVEDFAKTVKFKDFFNSHKGYYNKIIEGYKREYLLREMTAFLSKEFGNYFSNKKYTVVISPFVYAQNLHRDIDSTWTADFPSIAKALIDSKTITQEEKSTEIHTLFTEMDHGYVNPTTEKFSTKVKFDEKLWDAESGYAVGENAVFNEYMTWAVFDIFNAKYFPDISATINLNWHFQNESRGFIYSGLFAEKVTKLYQKNKKTKTIEDLYPAILSWASEIQNTLSKPKLLNDSDTIRINDSKTYIQLRFSEPMVEAGEFDIVLQFGQWDKKVITIDKNYNLAWDGNGTKATFDIELPHKDEYYLLLNWWGVAKPLTSKKRVYLLANSGFIVKPR